MCVCMCVSLLDRSSFIIVYVCWHLILVSPMVISGASIPSKYLLILFIIVFVFVIFEGK